MLAFRFVKFNQNRNSSIALKESTKQNLDRISQEDRLLQARKKRWLQDRRRKKSPNRSSYHLTEAWYNLVECPALCSKY